MRRTCSCIEGGIRDEHGQASVEAAILLPVVMLLVGMLVQPVCLLYTRSVMRSAAAEATRTLLSADEDEVRAFVLRRLAAVPDAPLFHVGGDEGWDVGFERGDHDATVRIAVHARPLPLLGIVASTFGESDGEGVILRAEVSCKVRPEWLGGDYDTWVGMWG